MAYVDIAHVTEWNLQRAGNVTAIGTSDTSGMTGRDLGADDWTGDFTAHMIESGPDIAWGSTNTMRFQETTTGPIQWVGVGIVTDVSITVDLTDGGPIPITWNVANNGDDGLTDATGAGTAVLSAKNGDIEWEVVT